MKESAKLLSTSLVAVSDVAPSAHEITRFSAIDEMCGSGHLESVRNGSDELFVVSS